MSLQQAQAVEANVIEEYEDGEFDEEEDYDEEEEDEEEDDEFDGQVEELDEDEEEPQAPFAGGLAAGAVAAPPVKPWTGLSSLPAKTLSSFNELLQELKAVNKNKLTILLLGKSMMGKSSTANSLFNEPVAQIRSFQQDNSQPDIIGRAASGFVLTVIDTPGLLESDTVSSTALQNIAKVLKDRPVDVVLYLDRLDVYRVERTDQDIMSALSNTLGPQIWKNAVIGLTHGKAVAPPGTTLGEYMQKRIDQMQKAIRGAGAGKGAALPAALIENSSHCITNDDNEKVIGPNRDIRWLPELMTQIVSVAQSTSPFVYDPKMSKRRNPNSRRKWLIPFLLIAQVAFKKYVIDRILEDDGVTGDQYGPYDADTIKEERHRLKSQKANAKARRKAEQDKLAKQAAKKKAQAQSQISSGAAKVKQTVQDALPNSDSSSSDDSSSDSD